LTGPSSPTFNLAPSCSRYQGMAQDTRGMWTSPNGDRIAWFTEPDGSVQSQG